MVQDFVHPQGQVAIGICFGDSLAVVTADLKVLFLPVS